MKTKKIILISIILVVAIAATVGVSFAAWQSFSTKSTGSWDVESNVPVDLAVGTTTVSNPGDKYIGQTGLDAHGFFRSAADVELTATRDITIVGTAVVTCKKGNNTVTIPADKMFKVVFVVNGADATGLTLTKGVQITAKIVVIFPDLSDEKYKATNFSIKVSLAELKA